MGTFEVKRPEGASLVGSWFTILCTMAGTGILQLPYTLKQGGWVGVLAILGNGIATLYTGTILLRCARLPTEASDGRGGGRRPPLSYPDIGQRACGWAGRWTVHVFQKATLLGVSTLFLILAAKFLLEGLGGAGGGLIPTIGNDEGTWTRNWTLIAGAVVAVPVLAIPSLKEITALTAVGLFASLQAVVAVVVLCASAYPVDSNKKLDFPLPTDFDGHITHKTVDWSQMPSAFSAITLSFGGHSCFPSIQSHMARPEKFALVLALAYVCLLTMYLVTAIVGYWAFGNATAAPILSNFPTSGRLGNYGIVTKLLVGVHVLFAYPTLIHVFVGEVEQALGIREVEPVDDKYHDDAVISGGDGPVDHKYHDAAVISGGDHKYHDAAVMSGGDGPCHMDDPTETDWLMSNNKPRPQAPNSSAKRRRNLAWRCLFRFLVVALTTVIATYLPYFAPFMTLIGALCLTMVVFVLPVVFYWRLNETAWYNKVVGCVIVAVGIVAGGIGSYQAVNDIIDAVRLDHHHRSG